MSGGPGECIRKAEKVLHTGVLKETQRMQESFDNAARRRLGAAQQNSRFKDNL